MSINDDAPQFFAAALQGVSAEGPNVILSFMTPVPSADHKSRTYCTNVRIVMSSDSVTQMVQFLLSNASKAQGGDMHPMPETPQ
jgi:hypothetical protein